MSQDIFPDQDTLSNESANSNASIENQTSNDQIESSSLSNSDLTRENPLQMPPIKSVEQRLTYSSPLPPPEILRGYQEVLPGSVDRILKMAEKEQDHRIAIQTGLLKHEKQISLLGLIAAFFIAIFGIAGSVYLGNNNKTVSSGIMSAGTLVSLVTVFLRGTGERNQDKQKKDSADNDVEP